MTQLLVGYARVSAEEQDLTVQREALEHLGVSPERIYVDHGLTGTNRDRPGLREAMAACRSGDTLVVTKLDRLARSVPDARAIGEELTAAGVRLSLGGSVYDPNDAIGRLLLNVVVILVFARERRAVGGGLGAHDQDPATHFQGQRSPGPAGSWL